MDIIKTEDPGPQKMVHLESPSQKNIKMDEEAQSYFRYAISAELKLKIEQRNPKDILLKEYQKFKYQESIYESNDYVVIQGSNNTDDQVARIKKIILLVHSDNNMEPILLVQWFYRRSDLPDKYQSKEYNFISDSEVFETKQQDYIPIQLLKGECDIITYDEYENLPNVKDSSIFFKRAFWDLDKMEIVDPPVSEWERSCICNQPLNPDQHYVQCDKCEKWYHTKCVKISKEALKRENFICPKCK